MRAAAILIALSIVLLAAGCLQRLNGGSSVFEQEYRDTLSRVAISAPNQTEECRIGSCWCMVCKNGTNIFGPMDNLIGGYCYFEKNCTNDRMSAFNNRTYPELGVRQFMIGQGPTFGDFAIANTYCSDRLSMAVQWLIGNNETPYMRPDSMRTMCFLSKGVIPVYVLYSNGTNINNTRARAIGEILGTEGRNIRQGIFTEQHVGPTIVVTEMNFDKNRAGEIADQVRAIDQGCQNDRANNKIYCFIAVSPKMNDFEALDAVMQALGGDSDKVDLVAFGIDNHYVNGCDGAQARLQATNFSSYALYNHSKPTLIPYVMFDPGALDRTGRCNWTEANVVEGYKAFFPFQIQNLQKRGVIGIAPYSFNTSGGIGVTNPLNCTNCGVGRTTERMRAWYGGCQLYSNYSRLGRADVSDTTQILFGNESGTVCSANTQYSYMGGFGFTGRDIFQQAEAELRPQQAFLFSCDACLLANASRPVSSLFPSLHPNAGTPSTQYCPYNPDTLFPEVEQWASARNLDPMLVRAVIYTESGFDPCSAAKVCNQGYDAPGCFEAGPGKDECYDAAYDEMYIPENTPNCTLQLENDVVAPGQKPRWRWCAVGLMQSLEPPWTFWPAQYRDDATDGFYVDVFNRAGISSSADLVGARGCNRYNFNPFNATDSICIGTLKIERLMRAARDWIQSHRNQLNWDTSESGDFDKTNLFQAYVMSNKYAGFWDSKQRVAYEGQPHPRCSSATSNGDCWALGFAMSWAVNDTYCSSTDGQSDSRCQDGHPKKNPPLDCYGYSDFIQYVQECEVPFLPRKADPGKNKVEAYLWFLQCPTSMCPDGKRLYQLMERPLPASGTPYIPDVPPATGGTSGTGG
ncbi:MAG: hypothetical protein AB1529_04075 [Candidatus Micrarchaeota archaeon]